jgi:hypothetical protein
MQEDGKAARVLSLWLGAPLIRVGCEAAGPTQDGVALCLFCEDDARRKICCCPAVQDWRT